MWLKYLQFEFSDPDKEKDDIESSEETTKFNIEAQAAFIKNLIPYYRYTIDDCLMNFNIDNYSVNRKMCVILDKVGIACKNHLS